MSKSKILKDMQGKTLSIDDKVAFVAFRNAQSLTIGRITGLKKVRAVVMYEANDDFEFDSIRTDELVKL